eukprot:m51a1_g3176 hypothetical protein (675) ;mRNA; r:404797-407699
MASPLPSTPLSSAANALLHQRLALARLGSFENEAALLLYFIEAAVAETPAQQKAAIAVAVPDRFAVSTAAYAALHALASGNGVTLVPESAKGAAAVQEVARIVSGALGNCEAPLPRAAAAGTHADVQLAQAARFAVLVDDGADAAQAAALVLALRQFGFEPSAVVVHNNAQKAFTDAAAKLGLGALKTTATANKGDVAALPADASTLTLAFTSLSDARVLAEAAAKVEAYKGRLLINGPGSDGTVGVVADLLLAPLRQSSYARIAVARQVVQCVEIPRRVYFKHGCLKTAIASELRGHKRALIVTDDTMFCRGLTSELVACLGSVGALSFVHHPELKLTPTLEQVTGAVDSANLFKPDVIISIGGGCALALSKLTWLVYECLGSVSALEQLAQPFTNPAQKVTHLPGTYVRRCQLVCVPTTSGSGLEVSPAVTFTHNGRVQSVLDYQCTPDIAVVDPEFVISLPHDVLAAGAFHTLSDCVEAGVSTHSNGFARSYCLEALYSVVNYAARSSERCSDTEAREKMHYAASLSGMAVSSTFTGLCQALALAVSNAFHVREGAAKAVLLPHIVRYNTQQGARVSPFSPDANPADIIEKYNTLCYSVGLGAADTLAERIEALQKKMGVPSSFSGLGIKQADYNAAVERIALDALDNYCANFNPRFPVLSEVVEILKKAF